MRLDGAVLHDRFEGCEVNGIPVSQLEPAYDSLPRSLLLSLVSLPFVRFFLGIFGLLVTLRLNVYLFGFCQLEVLNQPLDRDHSILGNRVKGIAKVLIAQEYVAVHSRGNELSVVDLPLPFLVNALERLLQLLNLLIRELEGLLECNFRLRVGVIDFAALILVQELELSRHSLQLIRLDLHRGDVGAHCLLEFTHRIEIIQRVRSSHKRGHSRET